MPPSISSEGGQARMRYGITARHAGITRWRWVKDDREFRKAEHTDIVQGLAQKAFRLLFHPPMESGSKCPYALCLASAWISKKHFCTVHNAP